MESRRVKFIWARGTNGRRSAMDLVKGLLFSLKISGIQAVSVLRLTLNNHSSTVEAFEKSRHPDHELSKSEPSRGFIWTLNSGDLSLCIEWLPISMPM
jgi:hypothetical protein